MTYIPEAIFLEGVRHVGEKLAHRLAFGHWDEDDIRQEIYLLCVDARDRFDPAKAHGPTFEDKVKNFLFIHCKNRIAHLYRDKFHRNDPPCDRCSSGEPCSPEGFCKRFLEWKDRNRAKASLFASATGSGPFNDAKDGCHDHNREERVARLGEDPDSQETIERVLAQLPQESRTDFLRLVNGARFHKGRRAKLLKLVRKIVTNLRAGEGLHGQA